MWIQCLSSHVQVFVTSEFQEYRKELSAMVARQTLGRLISPLDIKKFAFELRNYHAIDAAQIAAEFQSRYQAVWSCVSLLHTHALFKCSITNGLLSTRAAAVLKAAGPNVVTSVPDWPMWRKFLHSFVSGFMPILWVATLLAFLSWHPLRAPPTSTYHLVLAVVLLAIIIVSSMLIFHQVFTFYCQWIKITHSKLYKEMQATQILQSYSNWVPTNCRVIRGREVTEIHVLSISCLRICTSNNMYVYSRPRSW